VDIAVIGGGINGAAPHHLADAFRTTVPLNAFTLAVFNVAACSPSWSAPGCFRESERKGPMVTGEDGVPFGAAITRS
jgi:hypothetical protein